MDKPSAWNDLSLWQVPYCWWQCPLTPQIIAPAKPSLTPVPVAQLILTPVQMDRV